MSRPIYVPRGKRRRQQQERLHGAFTGGFSAGYFNSVGSREGWTPDAGAGDGLQKQQRPEDFMDEQDHNEWGGPVELHHSYQTAASKTSRVDYENHKSTTATSSLGEQELFALQTPTAHGNVGQRLLRVLGWREGAESAFVPAEDRFAGMPATHEQGNNTEEEIEHLTKRRLRKIRVQQQRVKIPQPKLDTAGLGFDPFQNAPEFLAARDRRRKLAQERAQEQLRKVYRVSDVLETNEDELKQIRPKRGKSEADARNDPYVSFETAEDFVGAKSVGGFALREDDDDAYDDHPLEKVSKKVKFDRKAYDTVVFEHESDEDNHDVAKKSEGSGPTGFGSILSSWVGKPAGSGIATATARTADGRLPLPGYVLGVSNSASTQTRFRGPDLPSDYDVRKHVFLNDEHPLVIKALSHAEQLVATDRARETLLQDALESNATANTPSQRPMKVSTGKGIFAGVSDALKNRFNVESKIAETAPVRAPGLTLSTGTGNAEDSRVKVDGAPEKRTGAISISRSTELFTPEALLCKRFGVPVPRSTLANDNVNDQAREGDIFFGEIMSRAAQSQGGGNAESGDATKTGENGLKNEIYANRPSMDIFKSIYEPASGGSSVSESEELENSYGKSTSHETSLAGINRPPPTEPHSAKRVTNDSLPLPGYKVMAEELRLEAGEKSKRLPRSQDSTDRSDERRTQRKRRKKDEKKDQKRRRQEKKHGKQRKRSSKRKSDR